MFYTENQVPRNIRCQEPLVLSPSNPNVNLMAGFKPEARKLFAQAAAATLHMLSGKDDTSIVNLCDVFFVQPTMTKSGVPYKQSKWLVGQPEDSTLSQPVIIFRSSEFEKAHIFSTIKVTLTAYLHAAVIESRYHNEDPDQFIRRKAVQFIHDVCEGEESDWLLQERGHENYDVTFEIPVIKEGRMIKISCVWKRGAN